MIVAGVAATLSATPATRGWTRLPAVAWLATPRGMGGSAATLWGEQR